MQVMLPVSFQILLIWDNNLTNLSILNCPLPFELIRSVRHVPADVNTKANLLFYHGLTSPASTSLSSLR